MSYKCRTLVGMATVAAEPKTRRFEARLDAETDDLFAQAAALTGQSRSAFVIGAAREVAERAVARADVTLMPVEQFDAMMASLDVVEPLPELKRVFAQPAPYRRG